MKVQTSVKKRCSDCYIVKREGVLRVYCKKNPRHKQKQGKKKMGQLKKTRKSKK